MADFAGAVRHEHTEHVKAFLNELYAVMVDPCAEGSISVETMKAALLSAAIRDRSRAETLSPTLTQVLAEMQEYSDHGTIGTHAVREQIAPWATRLRAALPSSGGPEPAKDSAAGSEKDEALRAILKVAALYNGPFANQVWRLANKALYPEDQP